MVQITPLTRQYSHAMQDVDEQAAVLADLQQHPATYLTHPDGEVRAHADWTLEYFEIRTTRRVSMDLLARRAAVHRSLQQLYTRLRALGTAPLLAS